MQLTVYLSGEIHTNWREEIKESPKLKELDISFLQPVTDHALSDDCGVLIMGKEDTKFWHDNKGAKLNAIRTRTAIEKSDVVIVNLVKNTNNGMLLLTPVTPPHWENLS